MDKRNTFVINFIGGPSTGKSLMAAALYVELKRNGYITEYIQEVAKKLVWTKNYKLLNNQYFISELQYTSIKEVAGEVDFIITDGPIIQGLYYNEYNPDNVSSIIKTKNAIFTWHNEFNNINIFLERGNYPYEKQGRYQTESEAKEIDHILQNILNENNITYRNLKSNLEEIPQLAIDVASVINVTNINVTN